MQMLEQNFFSTRITHFFAINFSTVNSVNHIKFKIATTWCK